MDKKGVSVLIGFILLMLILMVFLALLQTQMIPSMCKNAELRHLDEITNELETLDKDIMDNKLTTVTFDLGVKYPKYPLLLSPPSMATQVISESFPIEISYDEILPNGSIVHRTLKENSDRILLKLNYFYNRGYAMLLENTAIFRIFGDTIIKMKDQQMFSEGKIKIVFVNATFRSFTSNQPIDVAVIPVSYGGYVIAKNVTVNFTTECPSYWNDIASDLARLGYTVTVNGNNVSVTFQNSTKLETSYILLSKGISITALQYSEIKLNPSRIIPTNPTTNYTLRVGESIVLGVKVLDRFNNPVSGVPINVTLTGNGVVSPRLVYSDSDGNAYTVFTSNATGNAIINFSTTFGFVLYRISITSSGVQFQFPYGVTYDANTAGAVFAFGNELPDPIPPSTNTTPTVLLSTVDIKNDDGVFLASEALNIDYHAAQRFEIYGLNTTNILETYVNWNGYGIGYAWWKHGIISSDGETMYLWNYTSGAYDEVASTTSSVETWLGVGLTSSELQNYVRDGKMIVLIVQNGITVSNTYSSELYTDYISVFQIFK